MSNKIKFKIGEFSKICQVTVKTLRHYEEIGLVVPNQVDQWTGYRYYDISQLRMMNRIVYLKQLGLSLSEITELFEDGSGYPDQHMINLKSRQCNEEMERLKWRLAELAKLETILHNKNQIMERVFEKSLPSRIFATHRQKIGSYQELFNLCPNVIGPEMARLGCECPAPEYCFTIEHQSEYGKNIDIEYFEAVAKRVEDSDIIMFKELAEVPTVLCVNHYGPYEKMPETFAELFAYVEQHGYQVNGQPRFCYIDGIWNKQDESEWLTEIQLPVDKR